MFMLNSLIQARNLILILIRNVNAVESRIFEVLGTRSFSVNSTLFKYIMIQKIYIHKPLHLIGIHK